MTGCDGKNCTCSKGKDYHQSQLNQLLPVDEYGISVKLYTTSGETKSMKLSPELAFKILKLTIKDKK